MNLHLVASSVISSVNPMEPLSVQISAGSSKLPSGKRAPLYQTPGAFTGSIAGNVLTVTALAAGVVGVGQVISGAGVAAGTLITALGTGTGAAGTYVVSRMQTVGSIVMTTSLVFSGQVQSLTWKDLQQLDGINMNGERRAIYLNGVYDAVVRSLRKGGDLITRQDGSVWLVAHVLEYWDHATWVKLAVVLQNQSSQLPQLSGAATLTNDDGSMVLVTDDGTVLVEG